MSVIRAGPLDGVDKKLSLLQRVEKQAAIMARQQAAVAPQKAMVEQQRQGSPGLDAIPPGWAARSIRDRLACIGCYAGICQARSAARFATQTGLLYLRSSEAKGYEGCQVSGSEGMRLLAS